MRDQALFSRRSIAAAIPMAALAGTAEPSGAGLIAHGDAALLALGASFEDAWREEVVTFDSLSDDRSDAADLKCDAAYEKTNAIVAEIELLPATTLAGLIIKARACSWSHSGEAIDLDFFADGPTTDARLGASIVRDLMALSGRPVPSART